MSATSIVPVKDATAAYQLLARFEVTFAAVGQLGDCEVTVRNLSAHKDRDTPGQGRLRATSQAEALAALPQLIVDLELMRSP